MNKITIQDNSYNLLSKEVLGKYDRLEDRYQKLVVTFDENFDLMMRQMERVLYEQRETLKSGGRLIPDSFLSDDFTAATADMESNQREVVRHKQNVVNEIDIKVGFVERGGKPFEKMETVEMPPPDAKTFLENKLLKFLEKKKKMMEEEHKRRTIELELERTRRMEEKNKSLKFFVPEHLRNMYKPPWKPPYAE